MCFIIAMIEVVCFISVNELGALFDLYCYIAPYNYVYAASKLLSVKVSRKYVCVLYKWY